MNWDIFVPGCLTASHVPEARSEEDPEIDEDDDFEDEDEDDEEWDDDDLEED